MKEIKFVLISILYVNERIGSSKKDYFIVKGVKINGKHIRLNINDLDLLNSILVESLNNNGLTSIMKITDNKITKYC